MMRLYPGFDPKNPWGTGWPKEEIINRINNGVHLINHDGHAYYDYNMRMTNGDVNALTNDHKFCFVYSQGCMSGGFDNPEGGDCIAEYFTVKNTQGAFAGIWNARYGFFWSYSTDGDSQRYHRQFWDAVFGENIREIGRANHDSKEDNLFLIQRSCMRWVIMRRTCLETQRSHSKMHPGRSHSCASVMLMVAEGSYKLPSQ